ncbi:hypothetical protein [Blastococcus sp. SYSU DS0619]
MRSSHDERPESASLIAARQLAEEAHRRRRPGRRRLRPLVRPLPTDDDWGHTSRTADAERRPA